MKLVQPLNPLHILQGPAFNTFTAFQQILVNTTTPAPVLPANYLEVEAELWLSADGEFSNTGTPTLGIGFRYGAATPATDLALPTAITTTTGATSWPWHAEWVGRCRSVGSAGTIQGAGNWWIGTSLTAASAVQLIPNTLALRTVTIDTTVAQALAPAAVWGTSSVSNTIRVDRFTVLLVG
jgi:hypothetical protein